MRIVATTDAESEIAHRYSIVPLAGKSIKALVKPVDWSLWVSRYLGQVCAGLIVHLQCDC